MFFYDLLLNFKVHSSKFMYIFRSRPLALGRLGKNRGGAVPPFPGEFARWLRGPQGGGGKGARELPVGGLDWGRGGRRQAHRGGAEAAAGVLTSGAAPVALGEDG